MSAVKAKANVLLEEAARGKRDELAAALRTLGFSGYAADAFCALVRLPEATAGDLIARTGIPDSKIYYALEELVERGLVAVQPGKPKTYRAVPPKQTETHLARILEEKHERERSLVTRVAAVLEPLQAATGSPTTDIAYVVKGLSNVVARAREMIGSARKEIVMLASNEAFLRKLEPDLAKAGRRRLAIKLAMPADLELDGDLGRHAEIREIVCACLILVVDREQVLTISGTDSDSPYGITSTDETLVRLGLEYWESPRCCVAC